MKRFPEIDIAKGIGIILMIVGHFFPRSSSIVVFIFTFHMPLFFLISGYFYRPKNITENWRNDGKRLLIPYFLTCLVFVLYTLLACLQKGEYENLNKAVIASLFGSGSVNGNVIWGRTSPIGAIWFLWALFWCRNVYNLINQKCKHPYVVATIVGLIATVTDHYLIKLPFAISPGLSAMIFYMLGDLCKKKSISWKWVIPGILVWGFCIKFSWMSMVNCLYMYYPLDIIGACVGTYCTYLVSKHVVSKIKWVSGLFEWLGKYSLQILCFHLLFMNMALLTKFTNITGISKPVVSLSVFIMAPIILAWITSWIPQVNAVFGVRKK